jgi:hypothetical protein
MQMRIKGAKEKPEQRASAAIHLEKGFGAQITPRFALQTAAPPLFINPHTARTKAGHFLWK